MIKHSLIAVVLVGLFAVGAQAQVSFVFDPMDLTQGVETEVTVSLMNTGSSSYHVGAAGFNLGSDAGLSTGPFAWSTSTFADPNWVYGVVPRPELAWAGADGGAVEGNIDPGGTLDIGTLKLTGSDLGMRNLNITSGEILDDNGFNPISITGGTTSAFNVVPEPATLAFLGLGGLIGLRRRKK